MISYDPLFLTLKKKDISTYYLIQNGIDKKTIHRIKHNENITLLTVEKICTILECEIQDVVKINY